MKGLDRLPVHMRASMQTWIEKGEPHPRLLGSFLRAVLENRLIDAFLYADEDNAEAMRDWARFLVNDAPGGCYGSMDAMLEWSAHGGLGGRGK